ncbi:hypothetical protein AB0D68_10955 [Streptomyces sp. NPDC048212]|uniref:hypothetical protein n=1 Tax=Streptomyces sp. NPDC048212 TaxID=3156658 RepID=UPI00340DAABF
MADEDVLGMIYGGTITETRTWVETSAMLVTECLGEPFGRYFVVVMTNHFSEDDRDELDRLQAELGRNLPDCVVEAETYEKAHPFFPGSSSFNLVTVYGG